MSLAPFTVTGARISLVPLACDDANDIYRLCQDPAIMQWTTVPSPYSRDQAREFVEKVATAGWEKNEPHWAIRTVATNTLVGTLSMRIQSEDGTLDVGYWVGADSRGSGHATEALILAARVAFDTLNAPRLVWRSRVGNWASTQANEGGKSKTTRVKKSGKHSLNQMTRWSLLHRGTGRLHPHR